MGEFHLLPMAMQSSFSCSNTDQPLFAKHFQNDAEDFVCVLTPPTSKCSHTHKDSAAKDFHSNDDSMVQQLVLGTLCSSLVPHCYPGYNLQVAHLLAQYATNQNQLQ